MGVKREFEEKGSTRREVERPSLAVVNNTRRSRPQGGETDFNFVSCCPLKF